jgi:hypothetical protein
VKDYGSVGSSEDGVDWDPDSEETEFRERRKESRPLSSGLGPVRQPPEWQLEFSRRLYYKGKWKYYWAIINDLFLRFWWSIKLSIQFGVMESESNDLIVATLAMLEVIRRFIWNFFRIENEHSKWVKPAIMDDDV